MEKNYKKEKNDKKNKKDIPFYIDYKENENICS